MKSSCAVCYKADYHTPVLVQQVLNVAAKRLAKSKNGIVVDCTVGGGGHAEALLSAFHRAIHCYIGIDRDPDAIKHSSSILKKWSPTVQLFNQSFINAKTCMDVAGCADSKADFILADLGVSSHQLDCDSRGFSFKRNGPLDMRFDQQGDGPTAADIVNAAPPTTLAKIFMMYGDETFHSAHAIAASIVAARSALPNGFQTTAALADCIARAKGDCKGDSKGDCKGGRRNSRSNRPTKHPATQCFQALRIVANQEFQHVEALIASLPSLLRPGGVFCGISFHSLEERVVAAELRKLRRGDKSFVIDKHATGVVADSAEVSQNPRSRSAKLHVLYRKSEE